MHNDDLLYMALAPNADPDIAQFLLYNDLAAVELETGKWFDGLASGEFTDMWGSEFEIRKSDLPDFVTNTNANIQATATSEGDVVGLPIDMQDHERGQAAGWIVDARMSEDGTKIQFLPKWTEAGRELIESGAMRFFSATFHLKKKVVVGGTLTNWPATRNDKEEVLLKPIELSSPLFTVQPKPEEEAAASKPALWFFNLGKNPNPPKGETPMKYQDLSVEDKAALAAEFVQTGDAAQTIEAEAQRIAAEAIAKAKIEAEHEADVDAFVALMLDGDEESQNGLPVPADELKAHLMDMSAEVYGRTKSLLTQIHTKRQIDFEEMGSGGKGKEGKTPLPEYYALQLENGDLEIKDLANPVLGLGDITEYDLSKWRKQEAE